MTPAAPGTAPAAEEPSSAALKSLRRQLRETAEPFLECHDSRIASLRAAVHDGLYEALDKLRARVAETADHPGPAQVVDLATAYAGRWLWKLRDVPLWAVALELGPERLRQRVASCGMVLLTTRAAGDLIDRHFQPQRDRSTLLVAVEQADPLGDRDPVFGPPLDSGQLLLGALLLCFEGLGRLAERDAADDPDAATVLRRLIAAAHRSVLGMVLERGPRRATSLTSDNEDWRCLYSAVDPRHRSPLHPFLERFHELDRRAFEHSSRPDPRRLCEGLLALGQTAAELPPTERAVASLCLGELLDEAHRLDLLSVEASPAAITAEPLLASVVDLPAVVDRFGTEGLEDVPCPVCGKAEHQTVLDKQGFPVVRCQGCRHLYVTPRLRPELQDRIEDHGDDAPVETWQADLCRLLLERAPGKRLLDVGCGRGELIRVARIFGFEAYGIDRWADLGRRLQNAGVSEDGYDAVVMHHVLDRFPDPATALVRVRTACNPGSLLYVAVPDMDSLQFRVFGREWEMIQPAVRLQGFTEDSLNQLLERCGFEVAGRIDPPSTADGRRPARWMELFRRLGGSASGELAVLARVAPDAGVP